MMNSNKTNCPMDDECWRKIVERFSFCKLFDEEKNVPREIISVKAFFQRRGRKGGPQRDPEVGCTYEEILSQIDESVGTGLLATAKLSNEMGHTQRYPS